MVVFSEDELHQARATPVLEIAKEHGAKLKRSGKQHEGPCPVCRDGDDRFWVVPSLNVAGCRGCDFRGDAIALEMHLSDSSFVDAVRALIGADAGTPTRRQPTAEEIAARLAREAERKRAEAEEQRRKEASAARIVAQLQPVAGTPGAAYLSDVRSIDTSHWAIRRALEDVGTLGWHPSIYFNQPDPKKPSHELNGQYLGAIVAVLTDPVTAERTGGITRTFIHQRSKVCRAMSLGGVGRLGIIRLSPGRRSQRWFARLRGRRVVTIRNADGVLSDVGLRLNHDDGGLPRSPEHRMLHDRRRQRPQNARRDRRWRQSCSQGLPTVGRRWPGGGDEDSKKTGGGRQRHHQAEGA
jgi:CHC2 zinc finger